jgi:GcrA cell cycle regulator
MNIHTNEWPQARIELLKQMCEAKEPFSAIAIACGVSRNAAIGKARREGFRNCAPRAANGSRAPKVRKTPAQIALERLMRNATRADREARARERAKEIVQGTFTFDQFYEAPNPVGLLALNENTCRWPYGDPKTDEFHFCGGEPVVGKPYCPTHCRMGYRPKVAA